MTCMEKSSITVEKSTLERFNALKAELNEQRGGPDHSADTFLSGLMDTWDAVDEGHYGPDEDVDALIDELREAINEQVGEVNSTEVQVHETERLINRIDDLETELKTQIEGLKR